MHDSAKCGHFGFGFALFQIVSTEDRILWLAILAQAHRRVEAKIGIELLRTAKRTEITNFTDNGNSRQETGSRNRLQQPGLSGKQRIRLILHTVFDLLEDRRSLDRKSTRMNSSHL